MDACQSAVCLTRRVETDTGKNPNFQNASRIIDVDAQTVDEFSQAMTHRSQEGETFSLNSD